MKKNICFIQARMSSIRLPGKVMLDLAGKTLLERVIDSVSKSKILEQIIVLTSTDSSDDIIEEKCRQINVDVFRGNLLNVLKRFYDASLQYQAEFYFRITADNPLTPAYLIDELSLKNQVDYSCSSDIPKGTKVERFSQSALRIAYENSRNSYDNEHVTPYMIDTCSKFKLKTSDGMNYPNISVTIDTVEDYRKLSKFYSNCLLKKKSFEILEYIKDMPIISSEKNE